MGDMTPGEQITVIATDPASYIDIPHFCNTTGHTLVESNEQDGVYSYIIQKVG
jgi:tRNA 2-thiouridine synthesizing protein A